MVHRQNAKLVVCVLFCLIFLTGCSFNKEEKSIEEKNDEEISYLQDQFLTVVNSYAKGEYYKQYDGNKEEGNQDKEEVEDENKTEKEIDWQQIDKTVLRINESLDMIMLDFSETNVSNEELINFRNEINNMSISASNEEEKLFLQNISNLYSFLPQYKEKYSKDKNKINVMKVKAMSVSSLVKAVNQDWEGAKTEVTNAETKYKEMMDDVDYMKEYSYNLNKVYVLLEEFKNAINIEELELAKIKYINLVEKM